MCVNESFGNSGQTKYDVSRIIQHTAGVQSIRPPLVPSVFFTFRKKLHYHVLLNMLSFVSLYAVA